MRKNISKIIIWATLIFVAYRLNSSFATTPEKAINDLFVYGVTGDSIGVEISFNNTMEHAYDLADVINGMIFPGDTIVDMRILEEQYNDSENLVRVDCMFTVRDTAGEEWTYREYFYMCKSPGLGWEIYNIKSYNDVSVNEN